MRMYEIFEDLGLAAIKNYDSAIKRATQQTQSGRIQKKRAELSKAEAGVKSKKQELTDISLGKIKGDA
ncbi:MAG: hypothetical protein WCJ64_01420 [Rhodospirillaceae bacterium]